MKKIATILFILAMSAGCTTSPSLPAATTLDDSRDDNLLTVQKPEPTKQTLETEEFEPGEKTMPDESPEITTTTSATPETEPLVPATPAPTAIPPHELGRQLFEFEEGEPGWYTVDDDVMGGVSDSRVLRSQDGRLLFSGVMSLDNNGGFSSARSDWNVIDLSDADGVLMRVRGDGKIYRLRIRTQSAGSSVSYNALFETTAGEWTLVFVPFERMVPTVRGFVVEAGPLNAAAVASFGFMLSDKQPGEFELEVDWMRALSVDELGGASG